MRELDKVFIDYCSVRKLSLLTRRNYEGWYRNHIQGWQPAFLGQLAPSEVISRFKDLSVCSPQAANYSFTLLNSLYNFAEVFYPEHAGIRNPIAILSACKTWNDRPEGKKMVEDYGAWYRALDLLDPAERSLIMFLALTGLRYNEAARLTINHIGDNAGWFLFSPKGNKKTIKRPIPHPSYIFRIIIHRRLRTPDKKYLFSRPNEEHFPFTGCSFYNKMEDQAYSFHCLRRGYIQSALEIGIEPLLVKQLVGHSAGSDMTHRYSQGSIEHLIQPAKKIEEHLLTKMGVSCKV